jgi:hypothetical protein
MPYSFASLISTGLFNNIAATLINNANFSLTSLYETRVQTNSTTLDAPQVSFESNSVSAAQDDLYTQLDSSSNFRNNAFTNPIISYDFKCGHYLGL